MCLDFCKGCARTVPELDYQRDFRNFRTSMKATPVFERIIELARWCKSRGIDLVLVNTPVHPLFFDLLPNGQPDYAFFVKKLHKTAELAGVSIFDPLGKEAGRPDFFRDSHHHSVAGAAWLSAGLAEHLRARGLPRERGDRL